MLREKTDQPGYLPSLICLRCMQTRYLWIQAFLMLAAKTDQTMRRSRGGTGVPDPPPLPEKSQNYRGFSNNGPDHMKNQSAFYVGPSFKWHFAGGPTIARF